MVRTKADGALRVAAGGKAPKKSSNVPRSPSSSPSPTETSGKDSFPVNKYCPREIPLWQKKITSFINGKLSESGTSDELSVLTPVLEKAPKNKTRKSKRSSAVLNESQEMDTEEGEVATKRFKGNGHSQDDPEINEKNTNNLMDTDG
ncbi:uncharacterized protein LOC106641348 [Copidosoma floridanum]|uniref:uncharacterized protein LOC106641348 n=1 Tax=Copidosoma floridanum TaxID=29053 RepID=UPI0006C99631|nr:uncharacterized protein LOC106641348 [Copidosoma floridanum]